MVPAGVLRGLLVAACVWLAVACVDDSEIKELLEEGGSHEEVIDLGGEAPEEPRGPYKCYQPEEGVVYNHPSRRLAAKRAAKVLEEHGALFFRQPNWWKHGVTSIRDEDGQETEQIGVVVWVSERVPDSELPEEDRIPDCIGDVPIEIREEPGGPIELLAGRQSPRHREIMAGLEIRTELGTHHPDAGDPGVGTLTGIARDNRTNERCSRSSCTP